MSHLQYVLYAIYINIYLLKCNDLYFLNIF